MGAVILQRTVYAEGLISDPGDLAAYMSWVRTTYPGRISGLPTLRLPLNYAGDVIFIARFGAIRDSLAGLAGLKLRLALFANYTSGPLQFAAYIHARRAGEEGNSFGPMSFVAVNGPAANFPGTANQLFHYEISIGTGTQRDDLQNGDELIAIFDLLQNGSRVTSETAHVAWAEARLELP